MKKVKFIGSAIFIMLLGFAISSCKGEDGADGIDGVDGADGNANVTIISLMATDIIWTTGVYIYVPCRIFSLNTSEVNQDIIDHGTVLGFVQSPYLNWIPLPFDYGNGSVWLKLVYSYSLNNITLYGYSESGPWEPFPAEFPEYRFLLITDNTIGKSATKESILEELKNAGIDANNYYEVCEYYGIKS